MRGAGLGGRGGVGWGGRLSCGADVSKNDKMNRPLHYEAERSVRWYRRGTARCNELFCSVMQCKMSCR